MFLSPDKIYPELGCGSGDVTHSLLFQSIPTTISLLQGVDSSKEMVKYAMDNYSTGKIKFSVMDIAREKNPRQHFPRGFDKIFSLYCLHWVKDLGSAVRNIHHLLEDGGHALVIFLAHNPIFRMYRLMASKGKWSQYMKVTIDFARKHLFISMEWTNYKRNRHRALKYT